MVLIKINPNNYVVNIVMQKALISDSISGKLPKIVLHFFSAIFMVYLVGNKIHFHLSIFSQSLL